MFTIRKLFKFEAAHQLATAYSKACTDCVHGHSYVVEVFFSSKTLNADGMVIDFGMVSCHLKSIVMEWDHALLVPRSFGKRRIAQLQRTNKKLVVTDANTTAEWMAMHLFSRMRGLGRDGVFLSAVRVHETDTGYAEYTL